MKEDVATALRRLPGCSSGVNRPQAGGYTANAPRYSEKSASAPPATVACRRILFAAN